MAAIEIFYPVVALVFLTQAVLFLIPYKRITAGNRGLVTPKDFALGESARVPVDVSLPNRNYMNLLEMPQLFYLACILLYLTQRVDAIYVGLAWAYFLLRLGHSVVHISVNHVYTRLTFFALSNVVLTALWIRFAFNLSD